MPAKNESLWMLPPPNADTACMRLYCFPYAGGGTWIFREWSKKMGPNIAVYPIKLPGRADRLNETTSTNMHALADMIVPQLESNLCKPYAFFGCSMGALLAYECATRLIHNGAPAPAQLSVASAPAPSQVHHEQLLHELPNAQFLEAIQNAYKNPMLAELNEEMLPLVLPALRGDITMYETYRPRPDTALLTCPISVMYGTQDHLTETAINAWQQHSVSDLKVRKLSGGHFIILEQEDAVIEIVGRELEPYA